MQFFLSKGFPIFAGSYRPSTINIASTLRLSRSYSHSALSPVQSSATSYFVPRNSRGSLPVYTDIRNGGTRYLVLVSNIRGDIHSLRHDLVSSLFEPGSAQAAHLKTEIKRSDTLIVTGGRWKHNVMDWLRQRGF